MAKNDIILLDGIIEQRQGGSLIPGASGEVFEFFCLEQILKDYDFSPDELQQGWIDGRDDGGFDGAFLLVNGHAIAEPEDFAWPKSNAAIEVWLISCKHQATFPQAPLDKMLATIAEVFDLGLEESALHGSYSRDLLDFRALLSLVLRKLAMVQTLFTVNVVYATRGDTSELGQSVIARAEQIEALLRRLFSRCTAQCRFVGAAELLEFFRRAKTFSLELPFSEHLATGKDSYVLIVKLEDYWRFISDESGHLRRYLFDSNVRDYIGRSGVNQDIARSLEDEEGPDFWWLNNGITILATNATIPGKTIHLQDIQIVNGLQTTETVFNHFRRGATPSRERTLLVKILVTTNADFRDRIIRATNNQSPIEISALHATDKIQRDIETVLEKHGWYYERRKHYYQNVGKPKSRLISPLYLATACVALVHKDIARSATLKTRFMRRHETYTSIFSERLPINLWPVLATIFKSVEGGLVVHSFPLNRGDRFFRYWRPLVAFLVVSKRLRSFAYTLADLASMESEGPITQNEVKEISALVSTLEAKTAQTRGTKPADVIRLCCEEAAAEFGIPGFNEVLARSVDELPSPPRAPRFWPSSEFIEQVDHLLPPQPWPPRVHIRVADQLGCAPAQVSLAIQLLIGSRRRKRQRNGVVLDS